MTPEQKAAIEQLRSEGYAVVIFTPDEIKDANASHLEDILVERGNIFLDSAKEHHENDTPTLSDSEGATRIHRH